MAKAAVLFDVDASVLQDALVTGSNNTATKSFYGGGLYVDADNKEKFWLGATYFGGASNDVEAAGTTSFSHQDVALAGKVFLDRDHTYSLTAGYGVVSKATYKDPTTSATENWRGTSFFGKISIAPQIGRYWQLGLSVLYHRGTYIEKTVSTTTTSMNQTRTLVTPCLALGFSW